MFLDRCTTGTNRREGKLSLPCRLCNSNMPLPSPSPLPYDTSVLRFCTTQPLPSGIRSQRGRDSLRLWNEIPTSQQGSRGQEKTEGDEINLQPSPSNTPASVGFSTTQTPFLSVLYDSTRFHHCSSTLPLTLWQHFCPEAEWRLPCCEEREKLYSVCAIFITFQLLSISPHTQQAWHKNVGVLCSHSKQSIFKNSWPWNAFTFHSTRGDHHRLRKNLLLRQPGWNRACHGLPPMRAHTHPIFPTPTSTGLNWNVFKVDR